MDIFLLQGYQCNGMTRKTHASKLICNMYSQKRCGFVWIKYMDKVMREIGFTPSQYDPCLYYQGSIIFLVYIDDCIMFGPYDQASSGSQHFTVDDQGDVGDCVGIQIQKTGRWLSPLVTAPTDQCYHQRLHCKQDQP